MQALLRFSYMEILSHLKTIIDVECCKSLISAHTHATARELHCPQFSPCLIKPRVLIRQRVYS